MCGIAGFWKSTNDLNEDYLKSTVSLMASTLTHRGPNDKGRWVDVNEGVAFGHQRLSIIDVSDAGHQPMISSDGRYVITYNGEVYNFPKLRCELDSLGYEFLGHSDTEVILASFEKWGVLPSINKFNGMFSFALWDRRYRQLTLVRDRLGEKPLYYGVQKNTLFFASELKAIRAHPDFEPRIDRDALASFLRFSYVPAPYSIYKDIKKLLPGNFIRLKSPKEIGESEPYWSLETVVQNGIKTPFSGSEEEAADELERRLKKTVKSRMVSDVPLGAFLSGGIDSSIIVALMQTQSDFPVNTFTIGFSEKFFNEAVHAKKVAEYLNTNHTEMYVGHKEAMEVIPKLPEIYDEPFADSSQIPTHIISTFARKRVTVAISGDGGDELFAGYNRYVIAKRFWKFAKYMPNGIMKKAAKLLADISPSNVEGFYERVEHLIPKKLRLSLLSEKYRKLAWALEASSSPREVYNRVVTIIHSSEKLIISGTEHSTLHDNEKVWNEFDDLISSMIFVDLMTYHPDDILHKVDRASMAVSLETRIPFLDHELVEFIMSLPMDFKLNNGRGKYLLRKVLYRHVPRELIERPKMGFTVPVGEWLKGPLKDWAWELIDPKKLREECYFKLDPVMNMWNEHLNGRANWGHQLWNILMFQSWLKSNN